MARELYDPIVTGGCPQCGTYMYNAGSKPIKSDAISSGLNPDLTVPDDRSYVRCARCGFVCNTQRDLHATDGSRLGWGISNTTISAT